MIFSKKNNHNIEANSQLATDRVESNVERKNKKNGFEFNAVEGKYNISDLILSEDAMSNLEDFISRKHLLNRVFNDWGLSKTHAAYNNQTVNIYGESGTGKSMAAHAIANALNKKLIIINYADIESKYVGETSKNICDLFRQAKDIDAIIFFDEADAILSRRVSNMSNATDVSVNQTRSVLLMLISDYSGVIIFATNFINNYDPAFMRRISTHIFFGLPDENSRLRLWKKSLYTTIFLSL